jgi:hypothetical protein
MTATSMRPVALQRFGSVGLDWHAAKTRGLTR